MVPNEEGGRVPVIISPAQRTADGTSYRIMMVPVKGYEGQGPANLTATLQQISQGLPIGILKTMPVNGQTIVVYLAPLPTSPSADVLGTFLRGAAKMAGQTARKLNIA